MDTDFSDDCSLDDLDENELQQLEEKAVWQLTAPQHKHSLSHLGNAPSLHASHSIAAVQLREYNQNELDAAQNGQQTYQGGTLTIPDIPTVRINQNESLRVEDNSRFGELAELWNAAAPTDANNDDRMHLQWPQTRQHGMYLNQGIRKGLHDRSGLAENASEQEIGEQQHPLGDTMLYNNHRYVTGAHIEGLDDIDGFDGCYGMEHQSRHSEEVQEYKRTIAELQEERERLQEELKIAQDNILTKSGEISIIRKNQEKARCEHEQLVQSLHNLQNEEREKQKQELEALRAEAEKIKTRNMFLTNDYQEVIRKNKLLERNRPATPQTIVSPLIGRNQDTRMASESPNTTPRKKKKVASHRDGFDDDEIMVISPSKMQSRTRGATPSRKRKRSGHDSPLALPLSQPRQPPPEEQCPWPDEKILEKLGHNDDRFDLLKGIITHQIAHDKPITLEALSEYSLPSSPDTTIASLLLERLTALRSSLANSDFAVGVCNVLLSIWREFMDQKYWAAFPFILDLLHFGIMWDPAGVSVGVLDEAVDLIQRTVDINAIPWVKRDSDLTLVKEIDVRKCLALLEMIALGVLGEERLIKRFWKLIRMDFAVMLLNANQPIAHMLSMLSILCTSVFPDSIGPLVSDERKQKENELILLDAATRPLIETPKNPTDDENCNVPKYIRIMEARKEVLQFLGCVAATEKGLKMIALHNTVITRLIRRLSDELDEIYNFRYGVSASVELLNAAVRLLHGVIITHSVPITMRHLVALTRIAFADGLVLEAGIDEDTVELANNIVEASVTPQEVEALLGLFQPKPNPEPTA